MKKRHLGLIGLASLLLFIILLAPASLIRPILPELGIADAQLGRLSGSLWNGSASHLTIEGHRLQDVAWAFLPSRLLLGRAALEIDASFRQRPVSTIAAIGVTGKLILSDTSASIPASLIADVAALPIGELAGDIDVDLEHAELAQGTGPLASGTLLWKQASVTVAETARLGDITIALGGIDAGQLIARLSNTGGDISLSGTATVADSGDYTASVMLTAGNKASNNVKNSLKLFAKKQPDGSFKLDHRGNIFQ